MILVGNICLKANVATNEVTECTCDRSMDRLVKFRDANLALTHD